MKRSNARIPGLDGLRGVAILMVLLWHYISLQSANLGTSFWIFLHELLSLMWSGVDLFFVLSGFLITGILLENRKSKNYWSVFYLRRGCRILPLYFLLLSAYGVARLLQLDRVPAYGWLFGNPMPLVSYATFTQNLFMGWRHAFGANWLGVTWSLALEEQFYLFLPILIYRVPRSRLPVIFVVGSILPAFLRFCFPGYAVLMSTPFKVDPLFMGALVALIYHTPVAMQFAKDHVRGIWLLFSLLILGALAMTFHLGPLSTNFVLFGRFSSVSFGEIGLLYAVLLLLLLLKPDTMAFRFLRQRWLVWLGGISFFTYLFHQLISGIFHVGIKESRPTIDSVGAALATLAALICTLILAEYSRRYFEKPLLNWGRSFAYAPSDK